MQDGPLGWLDVPAYGFTSVLADDLLYDSTDIPVLSSLEPMPSTSTSHSSPARPPSRGSHDSEQAHSQTGSGDRNASTSSSRKKAPLTTRKPFSSCDACRLRKIRCIKLDDQPVCEGCVSKGIECTSVFKQKMSGRTKRVQQAKDAYGESAFQSLAPTPIQGVARLMQPVQSRQSTAVDLPNLPRLLNIYHKEIWPLVPTTDYDRLQDVCMQAEFDTRRMDILDILLCTLSASIAFLIEAGQTFSAGTSQGLVCARTANASEMLLARALELVDTTGILRQPSRRGLEILRMLLILTSHEGAKAGRHGNNYRSFQSTFIEHLRLLSDEGSLSREEIATFFLSHVIGDSVGSAISGQIPAFTDDDIENFAIFAKRGHQDMINAISNADPRDPGVGYDIIFGPICLLARSVYSKVTSARARNRLRIDLEFLQEVPDDLANSAYVLRIYEKKLVELFRTPGNVPAQYSRIAGAVRFVFAVLLVIVLDELEAATVREISANLDLDRLQRMQHTFQLLQRTFVDMAQDESSPFRSDRRARSLGLVDGLLSYASVRRIWRLLKCPTFEEAGRSEGLWHNQAKIKMLQFYMEVTTIAAGYVVPLREDLPALAGQVNAYISTASMSALSTSATSIQDTSSLAPPIPPFLDRDRPVSYSFPRPTATHGFGA